MKSHFYFAGNTKFQAGKLFGILAKTGNSLLQMTDTNINL